MNRIRSSETREAMEEEWRNGGMGEWEGCGGCGWWQPNTCTLWCCQATSWDEDVDVDEKETVRFDRMVTFGSIHLLLTLLSLVPLD
jgi:hypothetical protein